MGPVVGGDIVLAFLQPGPDQHRHAPGGNGQKNRAQKILRGGAARRFGGFAQRQHQCHCRQDQCHAAHDAPAKAHFKGVQYVLGVKRLDAGVAAHKGVVLQAAQDQQRDPRDHAQHERNARADVGQTMQQGQTVQPGAERRAQDQYGNAARYLPGKTVPVGVVAGLVHGAGGGQVAAQQPVHGAAEQLAQGRQLFQLGQGAVALPFGNGLARNAQLRGQLLLGHAALPADELQIGAKTHDDVPPLSGWGVFAGPPWPGCSPIIRQRGGNFHQAGVAFALRHGKQRLRGAFFYALRPLFPGKQQKSYFYAM